MAVESEGSVEVMAFHHGEGDAIGEADALVGKFTEVAYGLVFVVEAAANDFECGEL